MTIPSASGGPQVSSTPARQVKREVTTATAPATCRWEYEDEQRCTRPPAPRRGTRGPAPVYCEQADEPGQPVHNPLNAWRAKTRTVDTADQDPQTGRAPVAEAIAARAELRDKIIEHEAARQAIRQEADEAIADARRQADQAISQARAEADEAVRRAQADADAAVSAAETRIAETERQAQELASQVRADAEALVRAAAADRDQARERAELRAALESRAQVLEESRGELRARAERAERDLDAARAELARGRQEPGAAGTATPARQRRRGQPTEG